MQFITIALKSPNIIFLYKKIVQWVLIWGKLCNLRLAILSLTKPVVWR